MTACMLVCISYIIFTSYDYTVNSNIIVIDTLIFVIMILFEAQKLTTLNLHFPHTKLAFLNKKVDTRKRCRNTC